ncbi:MAG: isoleucine--tRNA ligase, partial [Ruminococcaceae bacterium]|nr:isoleucine--tRNA ligase [Oscillospiraceae bacterium]
MPQDYSKTLNLPNTDFAMRANLPQREPEIGKVWAEDNIYEKMLEKNADKPLFILHDGPPFSNGNIHMGTALNKVLKDFINKYKSMSGFKVPYVPGWDNHGMPIESAIIKKNKLDRKKMSISEFRNACHDFAQDFVDIQMTSFKRLGVLGDWDNPYLTMDPKFEAREVKVFGEMYKKGYIYKGLKPVYWCPHDETALAEAEIEYKDIDCTSIYVKFKVKDDLGKLSALDLDNTYFVIWTTTTWTLPGNLAIAVHPREKYVAVKANGETYIVADMLAERTMKAAGIEEFERVAEFVGSDFEYMKAQHPFLDRDSMLVLAEYVTMDSGTGCVHTAPGFGADDYVTCMRYKMPIIVPVDDRGYQTEDAGKFAGLYYEKSNEAILADMKETGALLASEQVLHSYPHCWRCKNPIIFRATPQWFCSVDAFRADAVKVCENVQWMPAWGGDRMVSMINERADWCISRQRHWGLPIPVFYCPDCGKPVCTEESIASVSKIFAE